MNKRSEGISNTLREYASAVKSVVSQTFYLANTRAPIELYFLFFIKLSENRTLRRKYEVRLENFLSVKCKLRLSTDWFSGNIPFWLAMIDEYDLRRTSIKVLEIGSWEGLSSYFILSQMPHALLTCVDTWEGADEHKSLIATNAATLSQIEQTFDSNLSTFTSRLIKYKGTSFSFFNSNTHRNYYDLIYIDGSHHCDDVIIDALKCFEMLKMGGIMVFDDYFWRYYPKASDNPAAGINLFLRVKKGGYKIIRLYYQIAIIKTAV